MYEEAGLVTELATFASLESAGVKRARPGESLDDQNWKRRLSNRLVGWPVATAWDTIAVGRKPEV